MEICLFFLSIEKDQKLAYGFAVSDFGREQKLKFAKMNLFNRKFEFKPLPPAV